MTNHRRVMTVLPVLDEAPHIERCLESLIDQTWPSDRHRILVLDGGSRDGTLEIVRRLKSASADSDGPLIEVLDNPEGHVAGARNLALSHVGEETHMLEIIGHSWLPRDHIRSRMEDLELRERAIGRPIGAMGTRVAMSDFELSVSELAIESAFTSRLGGSGQFDQFREAGPSTVAAFCLHSVEAVRDVGGWDVRWVTGQDHDLNHRLVDAGWPVWRSAASHVHMAKRGTFSGMFRLGLRYGFWRTRQVFKHPSRVRLREFLPWFGLIGTLSIAALGSELWPLLPALYLVALVLDSMPPSTAFRTPSLLIARPLAIVMLHTGFSIGLLWGAWGKPVPKNDRISR